MSLEKLFNYKIRIAETCKSCYNSQKDIKYGNNPIPIRIGIHLLRAMYRNTMEFMAKRLAEEIVGHEPLDIEELLGHCACADCDKAKKTTEKILKKANEWKQEKHGAGTH